MAETDPAVGDPVILRGRILKIDEGVALVEVYRSYPVGGTVAVQCGALELDEPRDDGGAVPASKIVITCTQHGVRDCPCLSAPAGGSARRPPVHYPGRITA